MTCREFAEILIDYLDHDLPDDVRERIKDHLCACPPCVHYKATYELTIRITRKLPAAEMPPQLLAKLQAAMKEAGGENA